MQTTVRAFVRLNLSGSRPQPEEAKMRVRRVYIKKAGGEIASEACFAAWRGFSHLGYPLDFFEWEDLVDGCLPLDRHTLVVGGAVAARMALQQIGVEVPAPLNLPECLMPFAGRRVWETTLGSIRLEAADGLTEPVFIKPLTETKSFVGCVIKSAADLSRSHKFDDSFQLQAAEVVEFVSEWRYFVHRQEVVGVAHYQGAWSIVPCSSQVRQAIASYVDAPIGYALDFGVTVCGRTLLVEANDAVALGAHGMDPVAYARLLEDRWLEITGG